MPSIELVHTERIPDVSVIVPARNEAAALGACLRSLVGQKGWRGSRAEQRGPFDRLRAGSSASSDESNAAPGQDDTRDRTTPSFEVIVVDDHSTDRTREIAESFPVRVIDAEPLPEGWSGKCNACWSGAKVATGNWLLFTDGDTVHGKGSVLKGLHEAESCGAALLSYSPKPE